MKIWLTTGSPQTLPLTQHNLGSIKMNTVPFHNTMAWPISCVGGETSPPRNHQPLTCRLQPDTAWIAPGSSSLLTNSLVPRLSRGRGKERAYIVQTACTCAYYFVVCDVTALARTYVRTYVRTCKRLQLIANAVNLTRQTDLITKKSGISFTVHTTHGHSWCLQVFLVTTQYSLSQCPTCIAIQTAYITLQIG